MKRLIILLFFIFAIFNLQAAYLENVPVTVVQPNGDTLHCFATGDEFYHYMHDVDGFTIVQNAMGFFVYAILDENGELVPSRYIPGRDNPTQHGLTPRLRISPEEYRRRRAEWEVPAEYARPQIRSINGNRGTINNIVIFIRFSDQSSFSSRTYSYVNNIFNSMDDGVASMKSYFLETSYNKLTINTTYYPAPNGDVILSYQDSHPRSYYMLYDASTNPDGYSSTSERQDREFTLLQNAINYVNSDSLVPSSLNIDANNDGDVDNVCFVVEGDVAGWGDLLWPHKWSIWGRDVPINGKQVYTFNFQLAGSNDHYFGASTMCHEMFHSLGAPDLYHYDYYDDVSPVGSWDLMCSNGTPPQQTNAYMKYRYGKWIDEIPEITEYGYYTLHPLTDSTNNCYKIASGRSNQFYLLEYRKNTLEPCIPGSGLMIYRINTDFHGNADFDNSTVFDEVYAFRPGASDNITAGNIYNAYFSSGSGRTSFDATTNPHPFYSDGTADPDFSIQSVSAAGETISFIYGQPCDTVNNVTIMQNSDGSVTVSWTGSASSYEVWYGYIGAYESDGTIIPSNGNSCTISASSLQYSREYEVKVRAVCSTFSISNWSTPIMFSTPCNATSIPFVENFMTNEMPVCWEQEYVSGTVDWGFHDGGLGIYPGDNYVNYNFGSIEALTPPYNAVFFKNSRGYKTKLITPKINLAGAVSPYLSFWHCQKAWNGDLDNLKVYYRTSSTDSWHLLTQYTEEIATWQRDVIELPNPSSNYQIAFEALNDYGYGVHIDSIMVNDLVPEDADTTRYSANVCQGNAYTGHGFNISASSTSTPGTIVEMHTNTSVRTGQDSTTVLTLTVLPKKQSSFLATACNSYTWNGTTYTTSGSYQKVFEAANGCDSTVTLNLTISPSTHASETVSACGSYTWHGTTYTSSGNFIAEYSDGSGCHVDTLHLTINNPVHQAYTETACGSYTWINGSTYTESGNYKYTHTDSHGCIQVDTLHLTILPVTPITVSTSSNEICNGSTVTLTANSTAVQTTFVPAAVGDILCTDSTTVKAANWPVTGKTAMGIVFKVDAEGKTGWAVALHDAKTNCQWTTSTGTITDLPLFPSNAIRDTSGLSNTQIIINHFQSDLSRCPAVRYCYYYNHLTDSLGSEHIGWYLPAVGQLKELVTVASSLQTSFTKTSGTALYTADYYYWSSTAKDATYIYLMKGTALYSSTSTASSNRIARPIINFNIKEPQYIVSYQWNTGVSGNSIQVQPNETTTYSVTATSNNGCSYTVSQIITVHPTYSHEFSETANGSYTWAGTTYNDSGNYTKHFTSVNGCDSTVTLHLTVIHGAEGTDTQVVCESYTWIDGVTYTESTNTPTYVITGGSSLGLDSIVTLHLVINHGTHNVETETACNSYTWHGTQYSTSGTHIFTYNDDNNCPSADTLKLTINHSNTGVDNQVACNSYKWIDGVTYTQSINTPVFTLTNAAGCDSVVTLHLIINKSNTGDTTAVACESFDWYEHTNITSSCNNLTHTFTNAAGCDSVVTLHLTINHSSTGDTNVVACNSFTWYGTEYTSTPVVAPTHTFTNARGCDSVVTLHLTINKSNTGIEEKVACESYQWIDGVTYTQSTNTPKYTLTNAAGCDSVVTLHLTINHGTHNVENKTACVSYTWHGTSYTNSGTYIHNYSNNSGCASVDTLHLTINKPVHQAYTVAACGSYKWTGGNNQTYTQSGNYTYSHTDAHGCTQVDTLHLTIHNPVHTATTESACGSYIWNGITYTNSGDYTFAHTDAHGCNQVDTLHLTIIPTTTVTISSSDNEICQGSSVTLTASGTDANIILSTAQVGYILCTDSTVVKPEKWSVAGKTAMGVIFKVDAGGKTGWAVALHDASTGCQWATVNNTITSLATYSSSTRALADTNGRANTTAIINYYFSDLSKCPAAKNAYYYNHLTKTVGNASKGWYFPSAGQMKQINNTANSLSAAFTQTNGNTVSGNYWTSSVYGKSYAYYFSTSSNSATSKSKNSNYKVRPVYNFKLKNIDDAVYYLWSNGATTQSIDVQPDETTTYSVTATSSNGCSYTASQTITVHPVYSHEFSENACSSYTWAGTTYTNSGNYTKQFTSIYGCDSTVTLHLTIFNVTEGVDNKVACENYKWIDNVTYTESTNTPTFTIVGGNSHGCDSIVNLNLTIHYGTHNVLDHNACNSFTWHGTNYNTSGNYVFTYSNDNNCPSADTLHLTINHSNTGIDEQVACGSFTWINGQTYTNSTNTPKDTLTNAAGCDSVVTLHLTIHNPVHQAYTKVACDSYTWVSPAGNGQTYTQSGNYLYRHEDGNGCIQVDTLHLTINYSVTVQLSDDICQGEAYNGYDFNIPADSTTYAHVIVETRRATSLQTGCDSTTVLTLTVLPYYNTDIMTESCESHRWNDSIYTASGDYVHHFQAANGCDSVVTLHLTVNHGITVQFSDDICQGEAYNGHGFSIPADSTMIPHVIVETVCTPSLQTGCDSCTVLTLTVLPNSYTSVMTESCDSYTWNDSIYTSSGDYVQHFQAANGCDSVVTLHLTVNHSVTVQLSDDICQGEAYNGYGFSIPADSTMIPHIIVETVHAPSLLTGCDSTTVLTLTVLPNSYTSVTTESCDSYTWNDSIYTSSGDYVKHFQAANGCDSTVTLHLTLYEPASSEFSAENCVSYRWNDSVYTTSGDKVQHFQTVHGCDSTVTLHLTINEPASSEFSAENCVSYRWNDSIYTTSGDKVQHFQTVHGCDSTVTLHLTIYEPASSEFSASNCVSYIWNDSVYTSSGDKVQHFETIHGCDSVVTLHLTIYEPVHTATTVTAYDSYLWNETTYTQGGDFTFSHEDAHGCTQVDTLHLTLYHSSHNEFSATVCEEYVWNDSTYTISGNYVQQFTDIHGADSVMTLHLTVNYGTHNVQTETACESFTWQDSTYTTSGTYTYEYINATDCPSVDTLHLTINHADTVRFNETVCQGEAYNGHGFNISDDSTTYAHTIVETVHAPSLQTGCDSCTVLTLTVLPNSYTSVTTESCDSYTWNDSVYTTGGDKIQHFQTVHGCDSTVTLHLTIYEPASSEFSASNCESYSWNDSVYTTSGDKIQHFETVHGCDSTVTLHLTIYEPASSEFSAENCVSYRWNDSVYTTSGDKVQHFETIHGCDSTVTLHLTINEPASSEFSAENCVSYSWNDSVYTTSGDKVQHFETVHGCDSIVTLHLTIFEPASTEFSASSCVSYRWNDSIYTTSGDKVQHFQTVNGCDSVVTLHLIINYGTHNIQTETACETYTWHGTTYTTSGTYTYNYNNATDCPSVDTLNLTINHGVTVQLSDDICQGEAYNGYGFNIPDDSTTYAHTIVETVHAPSLQTGCDSTTVLTLTVLPNSYTSVITESCDSYTWNDSVYTTSGDYVQHFQAANGCDSTVTLQLTIYEPASSEFSAENCVSYSWNDSVYTTGGDKIQHFQTVHGCDSTVTLHLTIHEPASSEFSAENCASYSWNDSTYTTSGDKVQHFQTVNGCDSVVTLHLTINHSITVQLSDDICQGETYNGYGFNIPDDSTAYPHVIVETQNFASLQTGCDSITVLTLTVLPNSYTSVMNESCDSYMWNDSVYTTSGDKVQHFQTVHGCDSTVTLHLTIYEPASSEFSAENCVSYRWNDSVYTTSGDKVQDFQTVNGCDSTVTLHLTINEPASTEFSASNCVSYTWNDSVYTTSGDKVQHFQTVNGCDSTVTLYLTIYEPASSEFSAENCVSYRWNDSVYTTSGDKIQHFETVHGCDSTVTLHLTIYNPEHQATTVTAYDSYTWNGTTYIQSGDYTFSHEDTHGCTQVDTLHLTLYYSSYNEFSATACEEYIWNDSVYTTSGDYVQQFTDIYGADSVMTLHLTVNYGTHNVQTETACESHTWHDSTYTTSGTHTYNYNNATDCPSVDTLHLTINHGVTVQFSDDICQGEAYNGHGFSIPADSTMIPHIIVETVCTPSLQTGCDSCTVLTLTVLPYSYTSVMTESCDSYTWNDSIYTTSGDYVRHFQAANGCDSVVSLHLTINHSVTVQLSDDICQGEAYNGYGFSIPADSTMIPHIIVETVHAPSLQTGCDSCTVLTLTVLPNSYTSVTTESCDSYTWNDSVYTTSGDKIQHFETVHGCDSTVTLHLTIYEPASSEFSAENCVSYRWNDSVYTSSGDKVQHFETIHGCDSTVTLHLTINEPASTEFSASNCVSYTWNDSVYTTSGDKVQHFETIHGCDSTVTLHLTIYEPASTEFSAENCASYSWNDSVYTTSGDKVQHFETVHGCDSTVTIHLTIHEPASSEFSAENCVSYRWNDSVYTTGGDKVQHFQTVNGCDSTVTLHLTIYEPVHEATTVTAYDSYLWNGTTYTQGGDFTFSHEDAHGCTQVDTLHLTLYHSSHNEFSATVCEEYVWNDSTYTISGNYVQQFTDIHGADSVMTLHLTVNYGTHNVQTEIACEAFTWHDSTYTTSGTYTYNYNNATDCPSVDTLHLVINHGVTVQLSDDICQGEAYSGYGFNISSDSTAYPHVIVETQNFASLQTGCDSTTVLTLTVLPNSYTSVTTESCDSYTWNDSIYTSSGDYVQHFQAANGCDSVVSLHLTINHGVTVQLSDDICQGEAYNEYGFNIPDDSTTYAHTIVETVHAPSLQTGCDSTTVLTLTVLPNSYTSVMTESCDSYMWNDSVYTTSGDKVQHFQTVHGCDSTVTLHLTIYEPASSEFSASNCESYSWNDSVYTTSGDKIQHFETVHGCDSTVTLHLTIHEPASSEFNAENCVSYRWNDSVYTTSGDKVQHFQTVNGCDSAVTLHLTIHEPAISEFSAENCVSYTWNDSIYTTGGDKVQHFETIYGCDSTVTLHLTIYEPASSEFSASNCERYIWNDSVYTTSGDKVQHFATVHGCDSTVTLHLTIYEPASSEFSASNCESYSWNDSVYTTSGDKIQHFETVHGCDSTVTLHLTVFEPASTEFSAENCASYSWNDSVYTTGGDKVQHFQTVHGCDSTVTLHLTINEPASTEFSAENCVSYRWNDSVYTTSGDYVQHFQAANGCDSTVTLLLTIHEPASTEFSAENCVSYRWNDSVYTTSGDKVQHFETVHGCDSTVTLHLTIYEPVHTATTVTAYDSYTWNGTTYTQSGDYTFSHEDTHGCTQVDTLHLTLYHSSHNEFSATVCEEYVWNDSTYTISGNYVQQFTDIHGADSVMTLHLTVNYGTHNVQTEIACEAFTWHDSTYTTSGTYIYNYNNATDCPSVDTLHLTINHSITVQLSDDICQGEAYNEYGFNIPDDSTTYAHTIVETVHAPSLQTGCDSTTVLTLTVLPNSYTSVMTESCDSYRWNDSVYTTSGDYVQHFQAANGCDSVVTLHLTVNHADTVRFNETVCQGEAYDGYGFNIPDDSTTYAHTIVETVHAPSLQTGCDSTTVLTLTVLSNPYTSVTTESCDSYTWNDSIYTTSGDYVQHFQAANGCDSVVTLHLTVNHSVTVQFSDDICQGEAYNGHGFSIPADSTMIPHIIVETVCTPSLQTGCDSTTVLTLTVLPNSYTSVMTESCDSYTWNDSIYTNSGDYVQHFQAANGCDSVVTLHLTVNHSVTIQFSDDICQGEAYNEYGFNIPDDSTTYAHTIVETVHAPSLQTGCDSTTVLTLTVLPNSYTSVMTESCDSYTWNDSIYTNSGNFVQHFQAANGCDSVVTLHLTVNHGVTVQLSDDICQGEAYNGHGFSIPADSTMIPHIIVETVCTPSLLTGCDSCTVLTLTVLPNSYTSVMNESCDSYTWNDSIYTSSGDYVQHFQAANGCDSVVTLHLVINHGVTVQLSDDICQGEAYNGHGFSIPADSTMIPHIIVETVCTPSLLTGCDSCTVLTLTVLPNSYTTVTTESCDSYTWNDSVYTTSGDYVQHFQAANGCDSIVTLHLTINHSVTVQLSDDICQGEAYSGYGFNIPSDSTAYPHVIVETQNFASLQTGCDSCTVLTLTVLPNSYTTVTTESCDSYTWNDSIYTNSGDYVQHFQAANGCDSIVTLHLTINHSVTVQLSDDICQGEAYNGYGFNIPDDSTTYAHTIVETVCTPSLLTGCDSCTVLTLTVLPNSYTSVMTESCDSYTWNDSVYTTSGDYVQHFQAANGCDSVVSLHLTINHGVTVQLSDDICQGESYDGYGFFISTDSTTIPQTMVFTSYETSLLTGCDSTTVLTLTVLPNSYTSVTTESCDSYEWGDSVYTTSGDYIQHFQAANGCDSTVTLHLTINHSVFIEHTDSTTIGSTYTFMGYIIDTDSTSSPRIIDTMLYGTTPEGCDLTIHLILNVMEASSIVSNHISQKTDIKVFPNPTEDILHIETDGNNELVDIKCFSNHGSLIFKTSGIRNSKYTMDVSSFAAGTYILQIQTINGLIHKKFIKK